MADEFTRYHIDPGKHAVRLRLQKLLGWLTEPADISLTDREFVTTIIKRWAHWHQQPLIDPNE